MALPSITGLRVADGVGDKDPSNLEDRDVKLVRWASLRNHPESPGHKGVAAAAELST